MQPQSSLTIVLPAYNEETRLGPALDELFGYLRRHGEQGRDGAPGSSRLPDDVRVLVVDDGSADGTADLVRARPETAATTVTGGQIRWAGRTWPASQPSSRLAPSRRGWAAALALSGQPTTRLLVCMLKTLLANLRQPEPPVDQGQRRSGGSSR
jgi:hypothetical protein